MTAQPTVQSLEGARLKVERAREHLDNLDRAIKAFRATNSYVVKREFDKGQNRHLFRVHIEKSIPTAFGLIIGDAVHNLRSALDHVVWELSRRVVDEPIRRTAFPIFLDKSRWQQEMNSSRSIVAPCHGRCTGRHRVNAALPPTRPPANNVVGSASAGHHG